MNEFVGFVFIFIVALIASVLVNLFLRRGKQRPGDELRRKSDVTIDL